ncbi:MAG: hypothetical protein M5U01_02065 [Ardenticatenaceae bacterium]|nr:hypothetical protein [Ardenticatenaceae bacterium]
MKLSSPHACRIRSWSVFLLPRRALPLAGRWLLILALLFAGIGTPLVPVEAQASPPPAAGETATPTPSATPTATATASAAPTETATLSATAVVTATATPTATPASSETATPTASAAPSATATASPTLTATLTPTATAPAVTATPTVSPSAALTLTLAVTSLLVAPGESFTLTWRLEGRDTLGPAAAHLLVTVPPGVTPLEPPAGAFNPATGTLRLPLTASAGAIVWALAADATGPLHLQAEVVQAGRALARAALELPTPTASVDVGGGEVVGLGGRVRVRFPAGALPEAVHVRVGWPDPATGPRYALSGQPFELIAVGRASRRPVHRFGRPIEIEVGYDEEELRGDETGLTLFYWDEVLQTWRPLPTRVDPQARRLTALTDHLSVFDFDIQDWEAARLPSLKDFQVATFTGAATYALPLWVPPGPGGLQPELTLTYNSQVVDSATSRTQAAWVGMGWTLDTGSIERQTKGTNDYTGDDTFTLVLNGTSSLLLPGTDGTWHTSDERFWRIERTGSEGSDTWTVWDQAGTQYIFEARARYPRWSPVSCGTTSDDGPVTWVAWRWSLSRVRNPVGQQLRYEYVTEAHNGVSDYCGKNPQNADVAVYPAAIVYPHSRYVIRFVTESRTDYDPAWLDPQSSVLFQRARLKEVRVEHDADGNGSFEQLIRKYVVTYGTQVFPNVTWPANTNTGRTFSLDQIAEYGLNGAGPLPVTSFTYGDGLHLTRADNGYGGVVEFSYAPWYETESPKTATLKVGTWCSGEPPDSGGWQNGTCAGEGYDFHGEIYNDQVMKVFHPGAVYQLVGSIKRYNWEGTVGTWAQVGLQDGTSSHYGPRVTLPTDGSTTDVTAWVMLPMMATRLRLLATSDHGRLQQYTIYELPTRYRVVEQQRFDGLQAAPQTFTYSYEGAATNDPAHSADANTANPYVPTYSEFRGHAKVTEMGPDGRTTATWFHQDDERAGRAYQTQIRNSANQLLVETRTTHEVNAGVTVSPMPVKEGGSAYTGLAITWTRLAQEQTLTYEGDTIFAGWQTVYQHAASEQGGTQYGNVTLATDSTWTGSGWTATRATRTWYYPNPSAYLVGLPAAQNVYACSGSCPTSALTDSALQAQTLYVYDQNGNNTGWNQAPQSLGHLTARRTFLRWNQPSTWSDPRYSDETSTYDAWGNRNGVTRYTGEGTSTTLASGARTTTTGYDSIYRTYRVSETNALNHVTTWDYSTNNGYALGLPTRETDANGAVTRATYDAYGRLLTLIRPYDWNESPTLRVEYHDDQQPFWIGLTQKTGAAPFIRRQVYDGLGRQIQVQTAGAVLDSGPQDVVVDRRFDGDGRLIQETVPYSIGRWGGSGSPYRGQQWSQPSTQTGYDALGRPSAVTAPDGTRSEHRYGVIAEGSTILVWHDVLDPNRHRMQTRSDALGRLVQVLELTGNCGSWDYACSGVYTTPWTAGTTTHYTYDVLDRLTTVTRGSLVTSIGYDAAGRKTQLQDPDMGAWTYAYDGAGNLTRQTDARGQTVCFSYDALHRLTGKTYRTDPTCPADPGYGGYAVSYGYDDYLGDADTVHSWGRRRVSWVGGWPNTANKHEYRYDERGRVLDETVWLDGADYTTTYGYDSQDQVVAMTYPDGEVVTTTYTPAGRPATLTGSLAGQFTDVAYVSESSYTPEGRPDVLHLGSRLAVDHDYYAWEAPSGQGRLQRLQAGPAADPLQDLSYTYDAVGNVTSLTESGETTAFSYDARDRLTGASGAYTTTYSYDALGNLLRKDGLDYAYDPVHPHAVQSRTLNGVVQESYSYDANGNLTSRNGAILAWDAENRLASLTQDGRVTRFTYDAEGRRVKTTTPWGTTYAIGAHYEQRVPAAGMSVLAGDVTRDCQVRLEDLQALAARWGQPWSAPDDIDQDGSPIDAGDLQAAAANWRAHLPAPCESAVVKSYRLGDRLVALRQNGQLRYVLTDHLGSVRLLADEQGRPVAGSEQRFFPFGRVRAGQPVVVPTARNFTGQPLDVTTGLLYYSAGTGYGRYYDPLLGRFIQPDTIVPEPGNPLAYDRYAYVANNPLKYTDPDGHCWGPAAGLRNTFYSTTCNNLDMALTIVQHPEASAKDKAIAGAYIVAEGVAHAALAVGVAGVACGLTPGCAAAVEPALNIGGTAGSVACADGNCTNEGEAAAQVGREALERLKYWTKTTTHEGIKIYQRDDLIDLNRVDKAGRTSLELMQKGRPPVGPDGKSINIHHMLQMNEGPVAEVTQTFHQKFHGIIHINPSSVPSGIDRAAFEAWKRGYWITRALDFK